VVVVNACEHGNESSRSIEFWRFLSSRAISGFSRRAQLRGVR
jgi:hypothetical protein